MRLRRLVTTVTCLLAGLLLLAIIYCALAPSSHMREVWFIPEWLGVWADRNPTFRNFPVFAALAAMLVFVLSLFPLNHRPTEPSLRDSVRQSRGQTPNHPPSRLALSRLGWFDLALFAAVVAGVIGVALEFLQPHFRLRPRDPSLEDISWSVAGAFAGALLGALACQVLARPQPATSHT